MATRALAPVLPPQKISRGGLVNINSNINKISDVLAYELSVAWHGMASPVAKERFFNESWAALKTSLGEYIDAKAATNPKSLHHVYEWDMIGDPAGRLWRIKKLRTGPDSFSIQYYFVNSKKVVPVDPILRAPGKTGRSVKKSTIFKNKATIMEEGHPVVVKRKRAKYLAIPSKDFNGTGKGIVFTKGPVTITRPGGIKVRASFAKTFSGWFKSGIGTRTLRNSGAFARVSARVTRAGRNVPPAIKSVKIGGGMTSAQIDALAEAAVRAL